MNELFLSQVPTSFKTCRHCHKSKPLSEFHRMTKAPDGHQHWCKECQREYALRHGVGTGKMFGRRWRRVYNDLVSKRKAYKEALSIYHLEFKDDLIEERLESDNQTSML